MASKTCASRVWPSMSSAPSKSMTPAGCTVMPGAASLAGSGVEATYTADPSAGHGHGDGAVGAGGQRGRRRPVDHSGVKVAPGVPVANVALLSPSALLLTTRYSTRSSRSTREKARTPGPSAA